VAQSIVNGLGYAGVHFTLLQARAATDLDAALRELAMRDVQVPARRASFAVPAEKRATLEFALGHLIAEAANAPELIALPQASPFGAVEVNKDRCTLCMSCVGACPSSALLDNAGAPQLRFLEKNCVQCGLCAKTCPEDAIALVPRLVTTPARHETRVLNEAKPFSCIRCGKPFGTLKGIEMMIGKLAGHSMFQGAALERLKMCGDCRVIDMFSARDETKITDL
jgi:ferredoxin